MSAYILAVSARDELEEILRYIADNSGESRAEAVYAAFIRTFELIAEAPRAGFLRPNATPDNVRWWIVPPYVVLYSCDTDPIRVMHVFHAARDFPNVLD